MATLKQEPHIRRGIWCLVVGVFTSWLGVGFIFILAAVSFGFVAMFGRRAGQGVLLFVSSLVLGWFSVIVSLHVWAFVGVIAFLNTRDASATEAVPAKVAPAKLRK